MCPEARAPRAIFPHIREGWQDKDIGVAKGLRHHSSDHRRDGKVRAHQELVQKEGGEASRSGREEEIFTTVSFEDAQYLMVARFDDMFYGIDF